MMKSPNRLPAALRRCQRYGIPAAFIFALMFHGLLPSGGWCFEVRELLAWMGQAFIWGLTLAAPLLVAASTSTAVGGIQSSGFCRVGRVFLAFILSTFLCAMAGALAAGSVEMTYPDLRAELGVRQDPTAAAGWSQMLPVLPVMPKLLMPGAVAAALGIGLLLRWAGSQNVRALVESAGIRLMAALRCYLKLLPAAVFCLTVGALTRGGFSSLGQFGAVALLVSGVTLTGLLVINPIVYKLFARRSVRGVLLDLLEHSAYPAFLSRSSLANIPMNLAFCRRYGVPDKVASITIPLGAAFNMPGAAVTLSVYVSLALIGTGMGDWGTLAAAAMCSALFSMAAAGIPNGSSVLLPTLLGLFGCGDSTAAVMTAYFVISVLQDSVGTALNSSSDAFLTVASAGGHSKADRAANLMRN